MRNLSENELDATVKVWTDLFSDMKAGKVWNAIKEYVKSAETDFCPSASTIYGIAKNMPVEDSEKPLLPEPTNGKCPYKFCDGDGYVYYTIPTDLGYLADCTAICPCHYDKRIRAEKNGNNLANLERYKRKSMKEMCLVKGESYEEKPW